MCSWLNKIQFFVLKILAFLIADYVMLMGEQYQPQLRGREGPGNKAIRWQTPAGRHWLAGTSWQALAMCGVHRYLGNRLVHACI